MAAAAVLAVATAVSIYGQHQARQAQKDAESKNAAYYREQQKLAEAQKIRSAEIFQRDSEEFIGTQMSLIAKSGVDFSGSIMAKLVATKHQAELEHKAILRDGDMNVKLAGLRAGQSQAQARYYGGRTLAFTESAGTLLNAAGSYMSMNSKGSGGGGQPNQSYTSWDE